MVEEVRKRKRTRAVDASTWDVEGAEAADRGTVDVEPFTFLWDGFLYKEHLRFKLAQRMQRPPLIARAIVVLDGPFAVLALNSW